MAARYPFDDADGDIVVRSSDEIAFRLYKNILAKASPIFRGMFTLPTDGVSASEEPQTVSLTEDADTLEGLFRLCYPVERPRFKEFGRLRAVYEAARKYEMDFVPASLKDSLLQFVDEDPLRVYAFAYIIQSGEVARAAMRRLVDIPDFADPVPPPPEFNELPAMALHHVFEYRRRRATAARSTLDNLNWLIYGGHSRRVSNSSSSKKSNTVVDASGSWIWFSCPNAKSTTNNIFMWSEKPNVVHSFYAAPWWIKYVERVRRDTSPQPLAKVVTDPSTLEPSIAEALGCATCAPRAWKDLTDFSRLLAEKMDEAASKVRVDGTHYKSLTPLLTKH